MKKNQKLKSLDEFSDESELFESHFEQLLASEHSDSERASLVTEITEWTQACAMQGRYIPLASAERRAFRSLLERWNSRLRDQGYYVEGIGSLADFDPNAGIVLTGDCPYPGLEPYTQSRRGSFFGREALVSNCIAHLEQPGNRILLIIGASGSGKSSLALAGVLPQLVQHHNEAWLFAPRLTPGTHPLVELAKALAQAIEQPEHANMIERSLSSKPSKALGQLAAWCQDKPLMLLIDQFEELLTMCRDVNEQSIFAQVLCALSESTALTNGFSCRILLTLRTDHLARFESNNALKQLHMRLVGEDNQHYLSTIGFEDIKRAIKGPADEVGLRFIPATLIDQLASQTAGLSNGLPLLQFALRRLWDTRPKNESGEPLDLINAEMVQALPDVERALGTVADGVFRTFSDSQQRICERLILELLVLDESFEEPLRRRRNEAELTQVLNNRFQASGDITIVIDTFIAAGLLRRFGEGPHCQLEVAHEALLRHWDHIYRLLTGAEAKERLHLIKQIGLQVSDWTAHGRANDYLSLRGERLTSAITYAADGWLAEAETTAYLDACKSREDEEKHRDKLLNEEKERADRAQKAREAAELEALSTRRNLWRVVAVAVFILAVGLSLAWYKADKESFAQELAMAAGTELERNSQLSLLLSIEAAETLKNNWLLEIESTLRAVIPTWRKGELLPEVESALRSALRTSRVSGLFKSYSKTTLHAVAYTPDGSALVLGDSLGGVTFWDVTTGMQRKVLFGHVDDVLAIAFSSDGRKMATGSADGRVIIWDTENAIPLHILPGHVDQVRSLAFSRPDGRLLASVGNDAALRIWDVSSGTPAHSALYGHNGGIRRVLFSHDERRLITAGEDDQVIMWDSLEGRILYALQARDDLFDIDLSTDSSLLAIATQTNVEIWDTATRGRRWTLEGHGNAVFNVRFSRDQKLIATASYDGTVRLWRLPQEARDPQRQPEELIQFHTVPTTDLAKTMIRGVAFSPKGDAVAVAFLSGNAVIWNVAGGGELLTLTGHETAVEGVAFSPDGNIIAAAGGNNGQVLTWDLSGTQQNSKFSGVRSPSKAVAFSPSGAYAVASHSDIVVTLPDAPDPLLLTGHMQEVNDLAFSPDGSRLVSGSHDGTAIVWNLTTGEKIKTLEEHGDHVIAVAYSPDGQTVATGSKDRTIILWQADTLESKLKIERHYLGILDLAFTPDSKRLVSGSKDKTVRVWDVATGEQQTVLAAHSNVVEAVAIHGDYLATAGADGIHLWDLRSLEPVPVFPSRSHGAQSLTFSPDGRYLAAGASDGIVRVYVMQGKELVELAKKHIHRGWTADECRWFLRRDNCPQTTYSLIEEAYYSFEKGDFKATEQLLREAKGGATADSAAIEAEVNSLLGAALIWAASDVMKNPDGWKEAAKDEDSRRLAAKFLLAAKEKLKDTAFDSRSRWRDLIVYQYVQDARQLAHQGELEASTAAFQQAYEEGWEIASELGDTAAQLLAVHTLTFDNIKKTLQSQPALVKNGQLMRVAESLLEQFPAYGPGHRILAVLSMALGDNANAKKHLEKSAAKELSAEPLTLLAELSMQQYEQQKDTNFATEATDYAKQALSRDPGSDHAWYMLGSAEYALKNHKKAVEAWDQVSPYSEYAVDALNNAASLYFEHLNDNHASYLRVARAAQLAPDDPLVLANFAEFLLALGRDEQASLAAARVRENAAVYAYHKTAMSFVMFAAEFFKGNYSKVLAELDEINKQVKAAVAEAKEVEAKGGTPETWEYKGTRRSLERRLGVNSTKQQGRALLAVLDFVETNGQKGALDDMRRLLKSQMTEDKGKDALLGSK